MADVDDEDLEDDEEFEDEDEDFEIDLEEESNKSDKFKSIYHADEKPGLIRSLIKSIIG